MNEFTPWLILLFWLFGFLLLWRIPVPGDRRASKSSAQAVSVIIPARNEAHNLHRLLTSLKTQPRAPLETIVVDDQSEDRTAHIAEAFGCRTIRSTELPVGWAGKPWACMQGARAARGDRLLFLDADTVVAPGGLDRILRGLPEGNAVVSVQPYHLMERGYERLSAVFNIIVMAGSNAFTLLGSKLRPMGAFGPCLLCLKKDYLAVGGHERVKGEILENVALGKVFLGAGFDVCCYGGKGVLSFRMYGGGFRSMVEGFTKSFGIGAHAVSWIGLLMIVCWVFGSVSLSRHLVQAAVRGDGAVFAVWAAFYLGYTIQLYWMLFRIGNFGLWPALLFPVPVLFFISVFSLSLFRIAFLKNARWKGRLVSTAGERKSGR